MGIFCYLHVERFWLYTFVATSLVFYFVPTSWLRFLQLSSKPAAYRRFGVHWVNHFTQNGSLVNNVLRRRYPRYRVLPSRAAMAGLRRTTYIQEQFHWAALVLFLLVAFFGVVNAYWGWALLITLANVFYNLYPIWLQQYIRVRLSRHGFS